MDQITFFWPVINILIFKNLFSCLFVDLICDFVLAQAGSFVFSLHMKSACKRMWLQPTEEGTMDIFPVFSLNFSLFLEVITWGKSALHSSRAFSTNFCQSKLLYNNSFFFFFKYSQYIRKVTSARYNCRNYLDVKEWLEKFPEDSAADTSPVVSKQIRAPSVPITDFWNLLCVFFLRIHIFWKVIPCCMSHLLPIWSSVG